MTSVHPARGPIRVLAISGSLRRASINTAALEALVRLAPDGVSVLIYRDLGKLPPFNPDDDIEDCQARAGRIVSGAATPCHRAPDTLTVSPAVKNALDWPVSPPRSRFEKGEGLVALRTSAIAAFRPAWLSSKREYHAGRQSTRKCSVFQNMGGADQQRAGSTAFRALTTICARGFERERRHRPGLFRETNHDPHCRPDHRERRPARRLVAAFRPTLRPCGLKLDASNMPPLSTLPVSARIRPSSGRTAASSLKPGRAPRR